MSVLEGTFRKLYENGRAAAVSPDGQHIAFFKDVEKEIPHGAANAIWLADSDVKNARILLHSGNRGALNATTGLKWSPDGRRIAFGRRLAHDGGFALETVALDGNRPTPIVADSRLRNFGWIANDLILYEMLESADATNSTLWESRVDPNTGAASGTARRVTSLAGFAIRDLQITADGRRMAILKRRDQSDVYVAELAGSPARLKDSRRLTPDDRIDWPGGWSADSKAVLFFSDRANNLDIFKQGLNDEAPARIVSGTDDKREPRISPDGAWMLYLSWPRPENRGVPQARLMRLPVSGGPPEVLLEPKGYPGSVRAPRDGFLLTTRGHPEFRCPNRPGAPCVLSELDGSHVTFSAFEPAGGRGAELARIDVGQGEIPFWDLSPDGDRIVFGKTDSREGLLNILSLSSGAASRVAVKQWATSAPPPGRRTARTCSSRNPPRPGIRCCASV